MESVEQWSVDHAEVGMRVAENFEGKVHGGITDKVLLEHDKVLLEHAYADGSVNLSTC